MHQDAFVLNIDLRNYADLTVGGTVTASATFSCPLITSFQITLPWKDHGWSS